MDTSHPASWNIKNLARSYRGQPALKGVSLEIPAGQVLAVLGEDGAGKSTLARVLAGILQPDGGEILRDGQPIRLRDLRDAQKAGLAILFDEPALATNLTVAENLYLGSEKLPGSGALLDWNAMRLQARRRLEELGTRIDPDAAAGELSPFEQRLVEIARLFSSRPSLLVMDEPAVGLGADEILTLNAIIRRAAEQGAAVLYLSERPEEVLPVAERIAVLREGEIAAEGPAAGMTPLDAASAMSGFDLAQGVPRVSRAVDALCLEARGLSTDTGLKNVSFELRRGEVLGLEGPGAHRLARALAGQDAITGGSLKLDGRAVRFKEPADALRAGLGITRLQRDSAGCLLWIEKPAAFSLSGLVENLQAPFLEMDRFGGFQLPQQTNLSPHAVRRAVRYLAGAGSEKKRVTRWLTSQAKALILQEPTRGLEPGARLAFYRAAEELAEAGISLILLESDPRERQTLADRVLRV